MRDLQEIKRAVSQLSSEDLAVFRSWFTTFEAEIRDQQFEADVKVGRLDKLAAKALQDQRVGRCTDL